MKHQRPDVSRLPAEAPNEEIEKLLVELKLRLNDGSTGNVLRREERTSKGFFTYLCMPCGATCMGQDSLLLHLQGKKHKKKLGANRTWPVDFHMKHPYYMKKTADILDEANKPQEAIALEKPGCPKEVISFHPITGDCIITHSDGIIIGGVARLQEATDTFKEPLVGLEYLVELRPNENIAHLNYLCTLCDKMGDDTTIFTHLVSFYHRNKFINVHFPKASDALMRYQAEGVHRAGLTLCLKQLAVAAVQLAGPCRVWVSGLDASQLTVARREALSRRTHAAPHAHELPQQPATDLARRLIARHLLLRTCKKDLSIGVSEHGSSYSKRKSPSLPRVQSPRGRSPKRRRTSSITSDKDISDVRKSSPDRRPSSQTSNSNSNRTRDRTADWSRGRDATRVTRSPLRLAKDDQRFTNKNQNDRQSFDRSTSKSPEKHSLKQRETHRSRSPHTKNSPYSRSPTQHKSSPTAQKHRPFAQEQNVSPLKIGAPKQSFDRSTSKSPEKHGLKPRDTHRSRSPHTKNSPYSRSPTQHKSSPSAQKHRPFAQERNVSPLKIGAPKRDATWKSWDDDDSTKSVTPNGRNPDKDRKEDAIRKEKEKQFYGYGSSPPEDDDPVSLLRLLCGLENYLGSLGPKIVDLLTLALKMDKTKPNFPENLFQNEDNAILLDTVREKLKGQLQTGLVEKSAVSAVRRAVTHAGVVLDLARNPPRPHSPPRRAVEVWPSADEICGLDADIDSKDKVAVAAQIAAALVARGKKNVSSQELAKLVEIVVGAAKAVKESETTSSSLIQNIQMSEKSSKPNISALQMLQSAYDDKSAAKREISSDVMDGLSDAELQTLLKNFKDLLSEEQHNLIAYLKKLEAKEPRRVERLRQFVPVQALSGDNSNKGRALSPLASRMNLGGSNPLPDGNPAPAASNSPPFDDCDNETFDATIVKIDSDDDNDYTLNDIFNSAERTLRENKINEEKKEEVEKVEVAPSTNASTLLVKLLGMQKSAEIFNSAEEKVQENKINEEKKEDLKVEGAQSTNASTLLGKLLGMQKTAEMRKVQENMINEEKKEEVKKVEGAQSTNASTLLSKLLGMQKTAEQPPQPKEPPPVPASAVEDPTAAILRLVQCSAGQNLLGMLSMNSANLGVLNQGVSLEQQLLLAQQLGLAGQLQQQLNLQQSLLGAAILGNYPMGQALGQPMGQQQMQHQQPAYQGDGYDGYQQDYQQQEYLQDDGQYYSNYEAEEHYEESGDQWAQYGEEDYSGSGNHSGYSQDYSDQGGGSYNQDAGGYSQM